ncbi:MAG TPA: mitochondrial fission ELM1 family protein [Roseiarcus sp.]|nr:mitochondrial fission ELM1 family protein [Roseiarcus sp.]
MTRALVKDGTRVLILSTGMAGHDVNCLGVAAALGVAYRKIVVAPRRLFRSLAPYGPVDPKDRSGRPGSILAPPFPDIVIASGRSTVPYIRALKREGGRDVFAVFLQDPRYGRREFDLIWTPLHDRLAGANVIATLTSPHPFSAARLEALRAAPDPRLAALPAPRAAVLLGGPSSAHDFSASDLDRLGDSIAAILRQGYSVMATPSRRTPPPLLETARRALQAADAKRAFVWDGTGDNPYGQMLAQADAILVTGDSVNMMGEAVSTGAPVYIFAPSGGGRRIDAFVAALEEKGAARRFEGRIEPFAYEPIDSSLEVANAIAERFAAGRH